MILWFWSSGKGPLILGSEWAFLRGNDKSISNHSVNSSQTVRRGPCLVLLNDPSHAKSLFLCFWTTPLTPNRYFCAFERHLSRNIVMLMLLNDTSHAKSLCLCFWVTPLTPNHYFNAFGRHLSRQIAILVLLGDTSQAKSLFWCFWMTPLTPNRCFALFWMTPLTPNRYFGPSRNRPP